MKYRLYDCYSKPTLITEKDDFISVIKTLNKVIDVYSNKILYLIVENDGKSDFPTIGIFNVDDYYNLIDSLTKEEKDVKIYTK